MSGLDGLGWPNPEDEPKTSRERTALGPSDATACSPSSDTPETDALWYGDDQGPSMLEHTRSLERQRNEAVATSRMKSDMITTLRRELEEAREEAERLHRSHYSQQATGCPREIRDRQSPENEKSPSVGANEMKS